MAFSDFKMRFASEYKGDVKDPVLTTILQTLDGYQQEIQSQLLLSVYAQRSDQISDGLFEVLRRHLFGQMFPGPAFVVAQASLRDVTTAVPTQLLQHQYMTLQNEQGDNVLFAPQIPVWIAPAHANDVSVQASGKDLMLGFNVLVENLQEVPDGVASVYTSDVDLLLIERLRCRLPQRLAAKMPEPLYPWASAEKYPSSFGVVDGFFRTPYRSRFLHIPFELLHNAGKERSPGETVWLTFPGLAEHARALERRLTLNAFAMWDLVQSEMLTIKEDACRFRIPIENMKTRETMITSVLDLGAETPIEYVDAASLLDPGYPFQYTSSTNAAREDIKLVLSPPPGGEVKVHYYQYNLGETSLNIAPGRSLGLYQGIDDRIKGIQSITPTQRLEALADKKRIWDYFRSMLASRNRWITRDDLRAAVAAFPPFSTRRNILVREKITLQERVGRMPKGFLTPFTDIVVPVREQDLLADPDKTHFEHELESYIGTRTVSGNFVKVTLVSADDV